MKNRPFDPPPSREPSTQPRGMAARCRALLESRAAPWLGLLILVVLSGPALFVGWLHDDFIHRQMLSGPDPDLRRQADDLYCFSGGPAGLAPPAADPWWRSAQMTTCFFRPLSSLTLALDHQVFASQPLLAHLHGLLWFLVLLGGVYRLAALLFDRPTARLALFIYGVSGFSGTPVAWLAARHTLVSAALSTWGLVVYLRGRSPARGLAAGPGLSLVSAALLGGEGALGGLGYVIAYELGVARDTRPRRLLHAGFAALIGAAYLGLYAGAKYGAAHSGAYLDPLRHPVDFGLALPGRLLCLVGEAVLGVPSVLYSFTPQRALLAALGALGAALVVGAYLRLPAEVRAQQSRRIAFLAGGALLGAIPAAAAAMGGRVLMLPGVGLVLLFAAVLRRAPVTEGATRATRWGRVATLGLALGVLVLNPLSRLAQLRLLTHAAQAEQALTAVSQLSSCAAASHFLLIGTNEFTVAMYGPYLFPLLAPPRTWHQLTVARAEVVLERLDDRRLRLRSDGETPLLSGFLYSLYRAPEEALGVASRTTLRFSAHASGVIHVEALSSGDPSVLRLELPSSLDDPRYCWLRYDGRALQALTPPPVGAALRIPYVRGPMSF